MICKEIYFTFVKQSETNKLIIKIEVMQEFITTTEKTNKIGNKYYTQEFKKMDMDNEGNFTEEITWKGIAKKADFDWCKMISETQPNRLVMNEKGILIITN